MRQCFVLAALWGGMTCAWAQNEKLVSLVEGLGSTQQRQLQALVASRQEGDGGRLFTDEEVRIVRARVPTMTKPLSQVDVEQLSMRINKVFGPHSYYPYRIVSGNPIFPVCASCIDGLDKTCHDPSLQSRRATASRLLEQHPHLSEAVGGLYLVPTGGAPELIGTVFVLQGRIVTNVHVLFKHTQPAGSSDVRKLKPELRLKAVFGSGNVRLVAFPADATWRRHPNLDFILTAWPSGVVAPSGLKLATGPLDVDTPVALLGFPSVNTNTDRTEDINRAFGHCPNERASEATMVISMGHIVSVSGAALEHDANTMGNSSGSPLIRVVDGMLVGVHSSDALSSMRNSAVLASALAELMTAAAP